MTDTWISVAEAARRAESSAETVRRAIYSGMVGWKRRGPRGRYLVNAADIEALTVVKLREGTEAEAPAEVCG